MIFSVIFCVDKIYTNVAPSEKYAYQRITEDTLLVHHLSDYHKRHNYQCNLIANITCNVHSCTRIKQKTFRIKSVTFKLNSIYTVCFTFVPTHRDLLESEHYICYSIIGLIAVICRLYILHLNSIHEYG